MSRYKFKRCASIKKLIQVLNKNKPTHTYVILEPKQLQDISEKEKNDFCQALAKNTTVRRLSLSYDNAEDNNLEGDFLDDIKKALEKNSTLVDFRFTKDGHDPQTLAAIQAKIANNRIQVVSQDFMPQPVAIELDEQELNEHTLFRKAENAIKDGNPHLLYSLISKYPQASKPAASSESLGASSKSLGLLNIAVEYGQIDCVKALLLLRAQIDNFDSQMNSALFKVIKGNYFVLTNLLLEGGASVNATQNGATPLHEVFSYEIGKLLIDYKADPLNLAHNGWSVLHSAIWNSAETELILYFLSLGVSVNAQSKRGRTALHVLSTSKAKDTVLQQSINLLIKAGANPLLQDKEGRTALDLAPDCDASLWKTVTRDYLRISNRMTIMKYGVGANSFFGAPKELVKRIALMVASTESLEPDTSEALVKSKLWN